LRAIAEATGGRVLSIDDPLGADLFNRDDVRPGVAHLPLWETLLVWTLAVFLLDVGTRRVAWDRLLNRELVMEIRRSALKESEQRSSRAAATLGALRRSSEGRSEGAEGVEKLSPIPKKKRGKRGRPAPLSTGHAQPEPEKPVDPSSDESRTSGLLEAKRRARERFGKD